MTRVPDCEVVVIGGGVVGCATALHLARCSVATVLVEAQAGLGLQASGTNSGILHTGFDSTPGELETQLILRAAALRDPVLDVLEVPILRCGAVLTPLDDAGRATVDALERGAERNGVTVVRHPSGVLEVPGESVTDPVAFTLALGGAAIAAGARVEVGARVEGLAARGDGLLEVAIGSAAVERMRCRAVVNCAGLHADAVAALAGDESFAIYPRKGEFLVFDPPDGVPLRRIRLPVPEPGTKGVIAFPTVDGKVVAGPTAWDQQDKADWSVRPAAATEIRAKVAALLPELESAEPVASYAGLRPAGVGSNYVIGHSPALPGVVHAAAIRSTGLTAALGIAEHVGGLVAELGIALCDPAPLRPGPPPPGLGDEGPWWSRTARYEAARAG
ncbi:MAG TPA: FAD-dependent oxidoreductase [Solirubrobacteraceae bacterium]|nr:FAD-dependent oxidoreductase [Solirubrobacteraceae bacterium]